MIARYRHLAVSFLSISAAFATALASPVGSASTGNRKAENALSNSGGQREITSRLARVSRKNVPSIVGKVDAAFDRMGNNWARPIEWTSLDELAQLLSVVSNPDDYRLRPHERNFVKLVGDAATKIHKAPGTIILWWAMLGYDCLRENGEVSTLVDEAIQDIPGDVISFAIQEAVLAVGRQLATEDAIRRSTRFSRFREGLICGAIALGVSASLEAWYDRRVRDLLWNDMITSFLHFRAVVLDPDIGSGYARKSTEVTDCYANFQLALKRWACYDQIKLLTRRKAQIGAARRGGGTAQERCIKEYKIRNETTRQLDLLRKRNETRRREHPPTPISSSAKALIIGRSWWRWEKLNEISDLLRAELVQDPQLVPWYSEQLTELVFESFRQSSRTKRH